MKVIVIDGQGGKIGSMLVREIKQEMPALSLVAIGTNSIATAAMLRAGAEQGATGENPVVYNCAGADVIIGPMGIITANAFLGEVTPVMAQAIGGSRAQKILIPISRCGVSVVGTMELPLSDYVRLAVDKLRSLTSGS